MAAAGDRVDRMCARGGRRRRDVDRRVDHGPAAVVHPWPRACSAPRHRPAGASTPTTLLVGHFIAILAALASLVAFDLLGEPPALVVGVSTATHGRAARRAALTLAGMLIVRRLHPAAGATTLLVGMGIVRPAAISSSSSPRSHGPPRIVALFPWAAARLGERTRLAAKATASPAAPPRRGA
jgi:hypothetical protein